ncbi:MAG: hypothetical protein J5705_00335 [Bacteroidaceae bacterium]|nr:hypothetical protein [Bacteroidaceae bacterium]
MKKKLIAMAAVAMFSVSLAFYANNSNLNVINETNVEALADGEGFGPYQVFGTYPNRILVDNITHVVTFEGKAQDKNDKGKPINACAETSGGTCTINTTTTVYNVGVISSYLETFFKGVSNALPIINWIMSLF